MKIVRRVLALVALVAVAIRGIFSFLDWFERQESIETVDMDAEEFEEAL